MQVYIRPFVPKPNSGGTVNVAVTASSQSLALGSNKGQGFQSLMIVNIGTQTVFVNFTVGAGTASLTTDMPVPPNTIQIFGLQPDITHVNTIAAAIGSTVYATIGEGS